MSFLHDLRYAVRALTRRRAFAALVIAILTLGIGAATTVFSIVDQTLLRSAPFLHGDRLVDVLDVRRGGGGGNIFTPDKILGWQTQPQVFERFEAYAPRTFDLSGGDEPERISGLVVSLGLFDMLGVQPFLGRGFASGDGRPGGERVVIVSQRLAERRWGSASEAVRTRIDLSGDVYTVVGVMPPAFALLGQEQAWIPIDLHASVGDTGAIGFYGLGRLAAGLQVADAQARAHDIADHLQAVTPLRRTWDIRIDKKGIASVNAATRTALLALLGAVGFLLLITCFNVAQLVLTHASERQSELAVHAALGAGRARMARQMLLEGTILAAAGGVGGVLLAWWGVRALVAAAPPDLVFRLTAPIDVDGRVLLATGAFTCVTAIGCGLAPAMRASRPDIQLALRRSAAAPAGHSFGRVSFGLVVTELAFSLVLLVGAALMLRTVANLEAIAPGFEPTGLVAMNVDLPSDRYPTNLARHEFFEQVRERLAQTSGVQGMAVAWDLTLGGFTRGIPEIEGESGSSESLEMATNMVTPEFFSTLRIPMIAGRTFALADRLGSSVIVNRALAERLWPDGRAVGRRFRVDRDSTGEWRVVVGVVGNLGMREQRFGLQLYEPWPLDDTAPPPGARRRTYATRRLIVRSDDPGAAIPVIRNAVWSVDPDQPITRIALATDSIRDTYARQRFVRWLMTVFAASGLLLAAAGVFGVLSQAVARRTREIGIRMAIGASPRHIRRLVFGRGGLLIVSGLAIGVAGAAGLSRTIAALLHGVPPLDPVSFAAAVSLLGMAGLLASWMPVRRALRVDPATAIRPE